MQPGTLIFQNPFEFPGSAATLTPAANNGDSWLSFRNPREILSSAASAQIPALLDRVEAATRAGCWAAGFLAYEAAPAFDPAFRVRPAPPGVPLAWFGIYDQPQTLTELPPARGGYTLTPWQPSLDLAAFSRRIESIRAAIAAGDTYQVNLTFPLYARFQGDPWALFLDLHRAQRARHAAFLAAPGETIVSASPELFFLQAGDAVLTRPMKGTAPRGRWLEEDERHAAALRDSAKNRAENVMIVDLLRNDLGRVARPGSVEVPALFQVERYPTVLQMTSTVRALTAGHPVRTLQALFPCGSITGAPKVRTMEIIAGLESAPRGVYTGAIGWIGPDRRAAFNVAIRTVRLAPGGLAVYGVGAGITWPSTPAAEYEECLVKARLLREARPDFDLLETLRWDPAGGWFLLDLHLARLAASARYFGRPWDETATRAALAAAVAGAAAPLRVRLLVDAHGSPKTEISDLKFQISNFKSEILNLKSEILCVALAPEPVDSRDPFLFHKTTARGVYDRARRACPDADDVLLWNECGELTESAIANIVVDWGDGTLWTPARGCGLLAGTFREHLLRAGAIREAVIPRDALARARRFWLINSVRGWQPAQLK